jgi:hypothetical protein
MFAYSVDDPLLGFRGFFDPVNINKNLLFRVIPNNKLQAYVALIPG